MAVLTSGNASRGTHPIPHRHPVSGVADVFTPADGIAMGAAAVGMTWFAASRKTPGGRVIANIAGTLLGGFLALEGHGYTKAVALGAFGGGASGLTLEATGLGSNE